MKNNADVHDEAKKIVKKEFQKSGRTRKIKTLDKDGEVVNRYSHLKSMCTVGLENDDAIPERYKSRPKDFDRDADFWERDLKNAQNSLKKRSLGQKLWDGMTSGLFGAYNSVGEWFKKDVTGFY